MSKILGVLRLLLWGYVWGHAWYFWCNVIPWYIAVLALILTNWYAAYIAHKIQQHGKKYGVYRATGIFMVPLILGFCTWCIDVCLTLPVAQITTRIITSPLWLPIWAFFLTQLFLCLYPTLQRYGLFLRCGILFLAFACAKPPTPLLFYTHPTVLAISLFLYCLAEACYLMGHHPVFVTYKPPRMWVTGFVAVLYICFFCAIFYVAIAALVHKTWLLQGGGLLQPTLQSFDLNKTLTLEDEMQQSQELLLFVHLDKPVEEKLLFKRHHLAGFHPQKGFFATKDPSQSRTIPHDVPQKPRQWGLPAYQDREPLRQEFYLVHVEPKAFFSVNDPVGVIPKPAHSFSHRFCSVYTVFAYTLLGKEFWQSNVKLWRTGHTQLSPQERRLYVQYGSFSKIAQLARQIVQNEPSAYGKAQKLEAYLKQNYLYSLKPGLSAQNLSLQTTLEEFLFVTHKGYCSYFAFSMALMARSLGLPARVATGFFLVPQESLLGYYPITGQQIHAWVEIFFDDYGWIPFDPTSEQLAPDVWDNLPPAPKPDDLYPFVEDLLKFSLQTENPAAPDAWPIPNTHTCTSLKTASLPLVLWGLIFALGGLCYISFLLWAHAPWLLRKFYPPRAQVSLCIHHALFSYNHIKHTKINPFTYLSGSTELLLLYRQALFAPQFTQSQAKKFCQLLCTYTPSAGPIPLYKKICFWGNFSWKTWRKHAQFF